MIVNFERQGPFIGLDPNHEKRKIYVRNPNMRDASTSYLSIPDTIDYRPSETYQESNSSRFKRSLLIGLAVLPVVLGGGYVAAIRTAEKKFFVEAAQKSKTRILPLIPDLQEKILKVDIKTADNLTLKCWDINPHNFDRYYLVCHGNSQNLNECQEIYKTIHNKGYGVLALEYRGYASNPGTITEEGLYKDADAALKYLRDKGIKDQKIGVLGYSLGGAVSIDLLKRNKGLGRLIAMSTFSNAKELSKNGVNYLDLKLSKTSKKVVDKFPNVLIPLRNSYQSDKKISEVECPITFIHSRDDSAIPITEAQQLYQLAKKSPRKNFITLPYGNHWFDKDKYKAISDAIDEISL